jgi:anti-sigma regulatory factor (Ser/Thr protein kinase)
MPAQTEKIAIRPDPAELAGMREFVRSRAQACGLDDVAAFQACLVATEAVTNAIRHGTRPGSDDPIEVIAGCNGSGFEVEVGDHGGLVASADSDDHVAEPYDGGGRGMGLMRRFTRRLDMETGVDGTRMRMLLGGPHAEELAL